MSDYKVVVMIDGSNTQAAFKQINERADFKKIRDHFNAVHIFYYTAVLKEADGNVPLQALIDWLSFNEFVVRTKNAKTYSNGDGTERTKGNMDVEIATDMMLAAGYADTIVLFSGDSDFCYAINEVQKRGVRVVGVSTTQTRNTKMPVVGDDFRRAVDQFVDIEDMKEWHQASKAD